jgi:hypothetical protein
MADALLDGANQPQREDDVTLLLARRGNHATAATLPPAIPQRGQR